MKIHHDPRPSPIRPDTSQPVSKREASRPTTPHDESGEFAAKFHEALERAGVQVSKPHEYKHSDYWMG